MNLDIKTAKTQARKAAFARRKAARTEPDGRAACDHLLAYLAPFRGAATSGYMPIRTEIDPLPAMTELARSGPVAVPKVLGAGQPLEFHRWHPEARMIEGAFGALVPVDGEIIVPRVVILPLAAFDARGYRLGYGGGFYDRTLAGLRAAGPVLAVGFAFGAQQVDDLPIEPTDQPMDAVVTETGVTEF